MIHVLLPFALSALALSAPDGGSGPAKPVGPGDALDASCGCAEDINNDGVINGADLGLLIGGWGTPAGDLNGSGSTDGADLGMLLAKWGPCITVPANDLCANAISIGVGVTPFCTLGATTSGPAFPAGSACIQFGYDTIDADVWYSFIAPGWGDLTVSTCGTSWDTRIAVYSSIFSQSTPCPLGGFDLIGIPGCSDDAAGCGLASETTFPVFAGQEYKIRVGGYQGYSGAGQLTLTFVGEGSTCEDAIDVNMPSAASEAWETGNTADNGAAPDPSSCNTGTSPAEWYRYIPQCGLAVPEVMITTCDDFTDFDTVISVWKQGPAGECPGTLVACNDDFIDPECQIGPVYRKSRVNFWALNGEVFYIRVSGYQGATGNFAMHIVETCH